MVGEMPIQPALTPIESLLHRKALHLVMLGFVFGARWGTAYGIATNKAIQGFIDTFELKANEESLRTILSRLEEEYREAQRRQ